MMKYWSRVGKDDHNETKNKLKICCVNLSISTNKKDNKNVK